MFAADTGQVLRPNTFGTTDFEMKVANRPLLYKDVSLRPQGVDDGKGFLLQYGIPSTTPKNAKSLITTISNTSKLLQAQDIE